ncbi:MAG: peptidoglycan editing factor PgeF [Chlamydiae bacterium]|nr:peptidoglycan editing factor PgeF [Chlamydiota bacterium]
MLEVLEDTKLKKLKMVQHGFFTRLGGVSSGVFTSLNCSYASKDNPDDVRENRRLVTSYFGFSLDSLVTVKNMHSNQAVIVDKAWPEELKPMADAMVTNLPKIILGTDSADCPIILLADSQAKVIGLSHAGWRGAKGGIIESTIEKMLSLGADPFHIIAAISPCIGQNSYEVGYEFYQQFLDEDLNNQRYFKEAKKMKHFFFDLIGFVKGRLFKLNIKTVSSEVAFDTCLDEKRFFSCRRSTQKGESFFGGHFSCIFME